MSCNARVTEVIGGRKIKQTKMIRIKPRAHGGGDVTSHWRKINNT